MKAALQNFTFYLLCMAGVVLAAPNQSTLYQRTLAKAHMSSVSHSCSAERPVATQAKTGVRRDASILEGSTRFELW